MKARLCAFCGDREQRWHGAVEGGWHVREGRDVCPVCVFVEPWLDESSSKAQSGQGVK